MHPPITDIAIGAYALGTIAALIDAFTRTPEAGFAWWLGLVVGLASSVLAAMTGFMDWVEIEWGSATWKAATRHLVVMLLATVLFLAAFLIGRTDIHGELPGIGVVTTVVAFLVLAFGGWLGGGIVFGRGMRVVAHHPRDGGADNEQAEMEPRQTAGRS